MIEVNIKPRGVAYVKKIEDGEYLVLDDGERPLPYILGEVIDIISEGNLEEYEEYRKMGCWGFSSQGRKYIIKPLRRNEIREIYEKIRKAIIEETKI